MIPAKLKSGDEIRVVSPASSLAIISRENRKIAERRFNELGLIISFSKHAEEKDEVRSSSIQSRVDDLHAAFLDKNVKAVFATIGGFNSNQLLKYLDYQLIKQNPKIFCGYSDITALGNAIYAKTGLVTYSGPAFSTLGMEKGLDYSLEYLKKCLFFEDSFGILPSKKWSDDPWYKDQEKRRFFKNSGFLPIHQGRAEGTIFGGNLCTLNLLHGTDFMPSLKGTILFLEDDEMAREFTRVEFDRNLQSILHLPGAEEIRGLVIGRFQRVSNMTPEKIIKVIETKEELKGIPVIAGVDFGHTTPHITFPIGGTARLIIGKGRVELEIVKH